MVIPTAASSDELDAAFLARYKKGFTDRGFTNVTVLHTRSREEANTDDFIQPIRQPGACGLVVVVNGAMRILI